MQLYNIIAHSPEALAQQLENLASTHGLAQLFVSGDAQTLQRYAEQVRIQCPTLTLIGVSATHIIADSTTLDAPCLLSILPAQQSASVWFFDSYDPQQLKHLNQALAQCSAQAVGVILSTPGFDALDQLLADIQVGDLPVAGGLAVPATETSPAYVLAGEYCMEKGCVFALMEVNQDTQPITGYQFGWQPISMPALVTHSEGKRVHTLNYKKVAQFYRDKLGDQITAEQGLEFPLLLQAEGGMQLARTPLEVHEDGSFTFAGSVPEGQFVKLSFGNRTRLIDQSIYETPKASGSSFIYSCMGRRAFLGAEEIEHTLLPFSQHANCGFFTLGEILNWNQRLRLFNETTTYIQLNRADQPPTYYPRTDQTRGGQVQDALVNLLNFQQNRFQQFKALVDRGGFALVRLARDEQGLWRPIDASPQVETFLGMDMQALIQARLPVTEWFVAGTDMAFRSFIASIDQFEVFEPVRFVQTDVSARIYAMRNEPAILDLLIENLQDETRLNELISMFATGPVVMTERNLAQWQLAYVSSNIERVLNLSYNDLTQHGQCLWDFLHPMDKAKFRQQLDNTLAEQLRDVEFLYRIVDQQGQQHWVQDYTHVVYEQGVAKKVYSFLLDVTHAIEATEALKKEKQQAIWSAAHDPLTGLYNRAFVEEALQKIIYAQQRKPEFAALHFIDLDNFKDINDVHGHTVGDAVLIEIAKRLRKLCRRSDVIARFGGDEFLVIQQLYTKDAQKAHEGAENLANKLLNALETPVQVDDKQFTLSGSIGVVLFEDATAQGMESTETIIRYADTSMHVAKRQGKGRIIFFDEQTQQEEEARLVKLSALKEALQTEQGLWLAYQPQVKVMPEGFEPIGAEVLVRWDSEQWGSVSPGEFIPLAEGSGLIAPLGNWVMQQAIKQLAQWRADGIVGNDFVLSINISAPQFHEEKFVENVQALCASAGLPPQALCLELTERIVYGDAGDTLKKVAALHERGFHISLDDFGTGYSSLSYLKQLKLDELKVDQSFVRDLLTDESDEVLVRTIISLGQNFGLKVVAEGTENKAVVDKLAELGCTLFQGYYFARPMSSAALTDWLQQHTATATPDASG